MVVVGAGPAGTSLALVLARSGLAVTLVEARSNLVRQFRGEALMPSGLDALAAMGLDHLLPSLPHRPLTGWRFIINGRELFSAAEPLGGDPLRPCTLVSQQALLELLIEQPGPSLTLPWSVAKLPSTCSGAGTRWWGSNWAMAGSWRPIWCWPVTAGPPCCGRRQNCS